MTLQKELVAIVRLALKEDLGAGDLTSNVLVPASQTGRARIVAKADGVVAGVPAAQEVCRQVDARLRVEVRAREGVAVSRGAVVAEIAGPVRGILAVERTALNFLTRLSGVATLTREFVERVAGTGAKILATRKTSPGLRLLEKAAVRAGGGFAHREGLSDEVLVKDNHWRALRDARELPDKFRVWRAKGVRVGIEADSLLRFREAVLLAPDYLLLDHFSVADLHTAVSERNQLAKSLKRKVELEASGNISLETVRAVAEAGVERISIGALTHSAPALDFSLDLT